MGDVKSISALEEVDEDIRAAIADRDVAFRKLMVKDTMVNRDTYADACAEVDALLELRFGMAQG